MPVDWSTNSEQPLGSGTFRSARECWDVTNAWRSSSSRCAAARASKSWNCGLRLRRRQHCHGPGQRVRDRVVTPGYVPDIRCVLGDEIQVPRLPGGVPVRAGADSRDQRAVVGEEDETPSFHTVPEMADRQVAGQLFPAEGAVSCLSRFQRLGEVGQRCPAAVHILL